MIKKYTLKDGTLRYGTIVYLGIDPLTGKQLRKKKKVLKHITKLPYTKSGQKLLMKTKIMIFLNNEALQNLKTFSKNGRINTDYRLRNRPIYQKQGE
nr:hypothetical protein [Aerococcus sp. Group 1]